jgi:hypothetical protein
MNHRVGVRGVATGGPLRVVLARAQPARAVVCSIWPCGPRDPGGQRQLAALARRYHERTGDAIAAARLGQIRTLLETAARAEMGPPDAPLGRMTPRMFGTATHVAALVLLGAALWFLWRAGSGLVSGGPLY